ncbi:MAG: BON domain-containing protein [Calditrichaeota bacterium]|nr:MAG: BON domain-containing protein [Calditrichota bacterium]
MNTNPLSALRKIILDDDRKKFEELEQTVQKLQTLLAQRNLDKETLINGLAPVIGDVLQKGLVDSKDEMIEVFAPIVAPAIQKQISESQHEIIDALYPVIGKTIRKAVSESMKQLVDKVNQRIDATLKGGLLLKKIKAQVAGVSSAELVIRDAISFRIEQIFLIHKSSGLLIAHVSASEEESTVDEELISGMLTAIKHFVSQAFKASNHDLNEIQYGQHTIILEIANYYYLAFVVSGPVPPEFSREAQKLSERIHSIFYKKLREFNGDVTELVGIQRLLAAPLKEQREKIPQPEAKPTKPYLSYFLLIVALPLALFFVGKRIYHHFDDKKQEQAALLQLDTDPVLSSLRQSVEVDVKKRTIFLQGEAPSIQTVARYDTVLGKMPKIKTVQNRIRFVRPTDKIRRDIDQRMIRFRQVNELFPQFVIEKDQVVIEGIVPTLELKREIAQIIRGIEGVDFVINNMVLSEDEFSRQQQFLYRQILHFETTNWQFSENDTHLLDDVASRLKPFADFTLTIRGYTDDMGSVDENHLLSSRRAKTVEEYLIKKGIPQDHIVIEGLGWDFPIAPNDSEANRQQNRRVTFEITRRR